MNFIKKVKLKQVTRWHFLLFALIAALLLQEIVEFRRDRQQAASRLTEEK